MPPRQVLRREKAHRKQHKKACKQRAAELKDEQLYGQGLERPEGDFCPLCTLPIPLPMNDHSVFKWCCLKTICIGCSVATQKRGMSDCAFCRTPFPKNEADVLAMLQARVEKKDPEAMYYLGNHYNHVHGGSLGLKKDTQKAIELWAEAAELGSVEAQHNLGFTYYHGDGVQEDKAKGIYFYEKAAMNGYVLSRHKLGWIEGQKRNYERSVRHFLI